MNGHEVIWTQPPTLLRDTARVVATPRDAFETPAILRFTTDAFMPEFMGVLESSPERLRQYKVRRETWRGFVPDPIVDLPVFPSAVRQRLGILRRPIAAGAAPEPSGEAAASGTPLKLYQPAHQRHYLVACSLVCKVPGLPDRAVDAERGEQTGCVIRRLMPPPGQDDAAIDGWDEYAWIPGEQGSVWQKVGSDPLQPIAGEERLPLFAVHYEENERRSRRLFAGVIPVARRDAYLGAPKATGSSGPRAASAGVTVRTSRKVLFRKEVIEPWKSLVRRAADVRESLTGPFTGEDRAPTTAEKKARLRIEREHIQTVSWLVLLDFARFLSHYVKPVWRAVLQPAMRDQLSAPERAVFDALDSATLSSTLRERLRHSGEVNATGDVLYALSAVHSSLRRALAEYGSGADALDLELERRLDAIDQAYDRSSATSRALWPPFLCPLADPDLPGDAPLPPVIVLGTLTAEEREETALDEDPTVNDALERIDKFAVLVLRAMRDDQPQPAPEPAVPAAAIAPANAFDGRFVIRCVYDRPACEPLHGAVMSHRTEPFEMAGFFDPDAPARPIRIGLPVDTTPAGLRKFDKNTAFVISDTLCGQIRRMKGLSLADLVLSVLPWPFHKDLPGDAGAPCRTDLGLSLGMICSISLPIITLCALILLMIMVSLFDIIFRWMAFFMICFPVPGLKAKK